MRMCNRPPCEPYGLLALRGDGRNMLRPYGLAHTYPSQEGPGG